MVQYLEKAKPPQKDIKEYFPGIGNPRKNVPGVQRKRRAKFTDEFPTPVFTDPECMEIIKNKDKERNMNYVKEMHEEVEDLSKLTDGIEEKK